MLKSGVQNIIFARARLTVEVLVRYLKDAVRDPLGNAGRVRGYRGGYLATQRREIERELRAGGITTVVSTNALELGIDIGQLDACILCGYPGTIASTWQQAGRAGRRGSVSLMILVAQLKSAGSVYRQSSGLFLWAVAGNCVDQSGQSVHTAEPPQVRGVRASF